MVYDYSDLIGRTITYVGNLSLQELDELGWRNGVKVYFDDGTYLTAARDDEGNKAGALWHLSKKGDLISIYS